MQNVTLVELTPDQFDTAIRKALNDFEQELKVLVLRGLPLGESHFVVRSFIGPDDGKLSFEKFQHVKLR